MSRQFARLDVDSSEDIGGIPACMTLGGEVAALRARAAFGWLRSGCSSIESLTATGLKSFPTRVCVWQLIKKYALWL